MSQDSTPTNTTPTTDPVITPNDTQTTAPEVNATASDTPVTTNIETSATTPTVAPAVTSEASTSTPVSTEVASAVAVVPNPRKVLMKQYAITALIVLLMGVVLWYMLEQQGRVNTGVFAALKSVVSPVPTALVINGEKIPMTEFDRGLAQLRLQVPAGTTTPEIETALREQTIELLTRAALLEQAAVKAGVEVTEEQVDARYKDIETRQGGPEGLATRLSELGLTVEQLRRDIRQELLIQSHLGTAIDSSEVAITDLEIETFYNNVKAQNPEVPPLADVRDQISQELRLGKEQELVTAYIETLRSEATIENRLEQ